MSRPTIYDVAAAAGVSKSLVSLVLRGSPRVSDASRHAVETAIRELGYRPSRAASALASDRTQAVGLLIDDYANPWFIDLARGLHEVLGPEGYRLSVVDVATASAAEDPVEGLLSSRVDGIVVAMDVPAALLGPGAPPLVIAGTRAQAAPDTDSVANDDRLGARLAVEHLLALGHRRIAHLPATGGASTARTESATAVLAAAGIDAVVGTPAPGATEPEGYRAALDVLRRHPDATAIFAANDTMAVGVLGAARELGWDVPGRLSVVGYDNSALAGARLIDLTTIDDRSTDVGREAGRLLASRMGGSTAAPAHRTLAPALVVRGTTAPPRA
ncbi:LacI family transcriptional regulator [Microbacterium mangrovi]|uniref:LacI family transcriptional regulator n=1 Tax=Microbacterium mangrovi TaxID=1348253 RepID=A0A0B2A872_9MICO|nr:LacI family DNA-binding transcriptional regulator [Microbacterium mangrovi]KHK97806.1 LacI family transcriptional regulator [Microbacterium mangrovi]